MRSENFHFSRSLSTPQSGFFFFPFASHSSSFATGARVAAVAVGEEKTYRRRKFVCCIRNVPSTELVSRRSFNRRGLMGAQSPHPLCSLQFRFVFIPDFSTVRNFWLFIRRFWSQSRSGSLFRDRMGHRCCHWIIGNLLDRKAPLLLLPPIYHRVVPLGYLMDPIISPPPTISRIEFDRKKKTFSFWCRQGVVVNFYGNHNEGACLDVPISARLQRRRGSPSLTGSYSSAHGVK